MPRRKLSGVCLYRAKQCWQILPYQYADRQERSGNDFTETREDIAYQSFYYQQQLVLVDLPGYGFAQRGKEGRQNIQRIIEDYILEREQLTNLFVLIDCRHEAQKIDLEFMEWLGENGVPFSIIFTKIDKISKGRLQENLKAYQEKLLETWEELPPILLSSSEKKDGREEILDYIDTINKSLKG